MSAQCPKCGSSLMVIEEPNTGEIGVICSRLDCDYVQDDGVWSDDDEFVCQWPDGTWCFPEELFEMSHMSDDYEMVPYNEETHGR